MCASFVCAANMGASCCQHREQDASEINSIRLLAMSAQDRAAEFAAMSAADAAAILSVMTDEDRRVALASMSIVDQMQALDQMRKNQKADTIQADAGLDMNNAREISEESKVNTIMTSASDILKRGRHSDTAALSSPWRHQEHLALHQAGRANAASGA